MTDFPQLHTSLGRVARLDLTSVLDRICVRPPYFALSDLHMEGTVLHARAQAEAPAHRERAPMTGAEIGRHAAIAGSCVLAQQQTDDRRRYYLAREARCAFVPNAAPYGSSVDLEATTLSLTKRDAVASIALRANGAALAKIDVSYAILPEATFERLFQMRKRSVPAGPNPYGRTLQLAAEVGHDRAVSVVEQVPAAACLGHFETHPALPVAALMGQLTYLAGLLAPQPFRVRRGLVRAQDLAWAGERVRFEARRETSDAPDRWLFECTATAGREGTEGRVVGGMTLWLEPELDGNVRVLS